MDPDYNALAKTYRTQRIPVVLALDNWWTGSLKQRLAALSAPWLIRRLFNRAWVPGEPQIPFAQKLGFSGHALATGFYCAIPILFMPFTKRKTVSSKKSFTSGDIMKSRVCANCGRLSWNCLAIFRNGSCIALALVNFGKPSIHPNIIHHGFKQPHELAPYIVDAACFMMPSKKEPWGVVLTRNGHRGIAIAHVTTSVGSAKMFLEEHENGLFI